MVSPQGKLCSLIIREHFGEIVEKVGNALHWGPKKLSLIVLSSQEPITKVKQALTILIKYGFVEFEKGVIPTIAEYTFIPTKVCLMLRYPRYILLVRQRFNEESGMLLEELLRSGFDTMTNVVLRVNNRITKDSLPLNGNVCSLRDKFVSLVQGQYVMRCPHPPSPQLPSEVPGLAVTEAELFLPTDINMKCLSLLSQGMEADDPGDKGICWRINFDRFHQDMRDELMISAVERRLDPDAAQLMSELLRLMYLRTEPWAAQTNAVPVVELKDSLGKLSNTYLAQFFDQYLKILEDSTGFVTRLESSSGMVEVNMSKAIHTLTCCAIDNIVDQRFGAKAARIFRLVRAKKYIEQERIQQLAMIPDKEAKLLTYQLLQENFLQMQELRKPVVTSGPNKTFLLFHVDLTQVARTILDTCYKAVSNTLTRRSFENSENVRLIEKKEKIESIAKEMKEQGEDEQQIQQLVDDCLTPPERSVLESVEAMIKKMNLAELQVDDTVFLLQLFTFYQSASIRVKPK